MSYWLDLLGAEVRFLEGRYNKTRVITAGTGEPLLLLHGTGGHAENYVKNIIPLSRHFRVHAIDFLWHGLSDTGFFDPEILPTLVDHVLDVQQSLALPFSHIEGQSLGGWVAMRFALQYPERVGKLVLTTPMGYRPDPGSIEGYVEPDRRKLREFFLDILRDPSIDNMRRRLNRIVADPNCVPEEALALRQVFYRDPTRNAVQQKFITEYNGGEGPLRHVVTDTQAAAIAAPTLVYWGEKNTSPAAVGHRLASRIPRARFFCAPATGHWAQFENYEIHNREVLNFLREQAD
jgi:2-hydroxy-6-oxonona-2,4-dienedioate hydrolase